MKRNTAEVVPTVENLKILMAQLKIDCHNFFILNRVIRILIPYVHVYDENYKIFNWNF